MKIKYLFDADLFFLVLCLHCLNDESFCSSWRPVSPSMTTGSACACASWCLSCRRPPLASQCWTCVPSVWTGQCCQMTHSWRSWTLLSGNLFKMQGSEKKGGNKNIKKVIVELLDCLLQLVQTKTATLHLVWEDWLLLPAVCSQAHTESTVWFHSYPLFTLWTILPSGKCYKVAICQPNRYKFPFTPTSIRLINRVGI